MRWSLEDAGFKVREEVEDAYCKSVKRLPELCVVTAMSPASGASH